MNQQFVEISGRRVSLSNLEKEFYPAFGFTKAHVLDYYGRIAEFILPHLRDRALTLKRYPDGVDKPYFFEKRCPAHRPAWAHAAELRLANEEPLTACLVNNLETLSREKGSAFMPYIGPLLDDILCEQYERTVQHDNCVRFESVVLQIPKDEYRCNYIKAKVRVHRYLDGTLAIFHGPRKLAIYDKQGNLIKQTTRKAA